MGFDIEAIIKTAGYVGLFLIVFAETGLLIGFFLPGDTLLLSAGLLIQQDKVGLELWVLIPLLVAAAIIGDAVGYQVGKHTGPRIFKREDSRLFHRDHLLRAQNFYDRHGGKTIVLARFLAFIRTFAPTVAGAAKMPYPKFASYNVVGAALWVPSMTLTGYYFGKAIPANSIDLFFIGLVVLMVAASTAPALFHLWRERRKGHAAQ
ncbi:MAG TPA: VTT domain-containing protein [Tepidiformaceae bacterium]|nr:VTT domain-containing protein [Tepidiformaceae bacterium]